MSKLPRLSRMLDEVFDQPTGAEGTRRRRFVTLDREGFPEVVVKKRAAGEFVYSCGHPLCGEKVSADVQVHEQVFTDGRWVSAEQL